jgi:DNA invertase Pin-like site-specific DNA recombinase
LFIFFCKTFAAKGQFNGKRVIIRASESLIKLGISRPWLFVGKTVGGAMRVAIYGRVSSDNKGQDPENQLAQLRAWCANARHEIVDEYVDCESGRKGTDRRKQFATLFEDASRRKFDCVLFWALDRFSREGMVPTILHLQRLSACGVAFHSYTEPHLATDNELVRNILLALLASLAKVEAEKISERTKAGMARAKAKGKRIGRPKLDVTVRRQIAKRIAAGATVYAVAKALKIDPHTAAKYAMTEGVSP